MQRIALPGSDLEVSILGYGVALFGTAVRGDDADRLLGAYHAAGGTLVDTAHCYAYWVEGGLGASERELGAAIRRLGIRDELVVATKGGHPGAGQTYPQPEAFLSPEALAASLDESLARLGMDAVDLYYLHRDDGRTPVGEVIEALNAEIARGRVRALGASNWSTARIALANAYAAAHGVTGFCCSQAQWSLAEPDWQPGPDPVTRCVHEADAAWYAESGIPVVAYSATANGYFAADGPVGPFTGERNAARRARTRQLAAELGCTATQLAVAWLLRQAPTVAPLFSTLRPRHMREAIAALEIPLSSAQARLLHDG